MLSAIRIEEHALSKRRVLERGLDPERREFLEDISLARPVLETLEIAMEAPAYLASTLEDVRPATTSCDRKCRGQTR